MISIAQASKAIGTPDVHKRSPQSIDRQNLNHVHCDRGEGIGFISPGEKVNIK